MLLTYSSLVSSSAGPPLVLRFNCSPEPQPERGWGSPSQPPAQRGPPRSFPPVIRSPLSYEPLVHCKWVGGTIIHSSKYLDACIACFVYMLAHEKRLATVQCRGQKLFLQDLDFNWPYIPWLFTFRLRIVHTSLTTSFSTSTSRSCAQRAFVYKGHCIFPEPWRATESGLPSGGAGKSAEVAMPWPGMYAAVAGGCTLKTIFSTSTTTLTSLITVLPPRPPAMTRCGYAVRPSLPLPPRPQCACDHDGAPRAALGSAHPRFRIRKMQNASQRRPRESASHWNLIWCSARTAHLSMGTEISLVMICSGAVNMPCVSCAVCARWAVIWCVCEDALQCIFLLLVCASPSLYFAVASRNAGSPPSR